MKTTQSIEEFIKEAKLYGQRQIRIAIVGDTNKKPWNVRVEAYNKLTFDTQSEDDGIFDALRSELSNSGFHVTIVARQPSPLKIDPDMLSLFSKRPPTGDKMSHQRRH